MRAQRDAECADRVPHPRGVPLEARAIQQQCGRRQLEDGAQGRDRTADTVIFSHVLYQLSYLGIRNRTGLGRISERAP